MTTTYLSWVNRLDAAVLSSDSAVPSLPVTNLQHPSLSRRWYTIAGVNSAYVLVDLGSALACDLIALFGANCTAAATLRIRASTSDPTAITGDLHDSGALAGIASTTYGSVIHVLAASVAARYWRLDIADASLADNLRIGRAWLGPAWRPTVNRLYPWEIGYDDLSSIGESEGGQEFIDVRARRRTLQFALDQESEQEMFESAFALDREAGTTGQIVAALEPGTALAAHKSLLGRLARIEPVRHTRSRQRLKSYFIRETVNG